MLPAGAVGFFVGWNAAAFVFIFLAAVLLLPKNHTVVVFEDSLTDKDFRGRFIRSVKVPQISRCLRNVLGEIILKDTEGNTLLRVESNMTNRDHFEQWLVAHHIESK